MKNSHLCKCFTGNGSDSVCVCGVRQYLQLDPGADAPFVCLGVCLAFSDQPFLLSESRAWELFLGTANDGTDVTQ